MQAHKSLFFLVGVFFLLTVLCFVFPENGITIGNITLRFPNIHKVLVKEDTRSVAEMLKEPEEEPVMQGLTDSLAYYHHLLDSSDIRFWLPDNDPTFFDSMFAAMENAKAQGRTVRILHYGDSQIEMDRLSDRLRDAFLKEFGGGGPGMLPILQTIASATVSQYASGALAMKSSYGDSLELRANGNYGLMTKCFRLEGAASATITASRQPAVPSSFKRFSTIKLIFNNRGGQLSATLSSKASSAEPSSQTTSTAGVQSFSWNLDTCVSQIKLNLSGSADIYCVLVDDGPGVAVDNINMRGCSGQQFSMVNKNQLSDSYSLIDVGLIILQFGGNTVPYCNSEKSRTTYYSSMAKQIDLLKEACPNAKILFIGPSDMSTRHNGELQSYPGLEAFIKGLQEMANSKGCAYWSIYHAMGGHNSMVQWNQENLAGADYIHFSKKGAALMGDRMAEAFMRMYGFYQFRKNVPQDQFLQYWKK